MGGQINRGSFFGEELYKVSLNVNFKNYVEVGTWNGQGSTKCFMDGILSRSDDSCLYSVEASIEFYNQANEYWSNSLAPDSIDRLKLLYGRLVGAEDLISIEEVESHENFLDNPWLEWRERNIKEYDECENVASLLPEEIDVLMLDGGQFSTRAEFELLEDNVKVVVLDDTTTFKTETIKDYIVSNTDEWSVVFDHIYEHHGLPQGVFMGCKSEYRDLI